MVLHPIYNILNFFYMFWSAIYNTLFYCLILLYPVLPCYILLSSVFYCAIPFYYAVYGCGVTLLCCYYEQNNILKFFYMFLWWCGDDDYISTIRKSIVICIVEIMQCISSMSYISMFSACALLKMVCLKLWQRVFMHPPCCFYAYIYTRQGKTTALHSRVTPISTRQIQKDPYYALSHTAPTARTEPIWDGVVPV